ncbi:MAG: hypothetical protein ABJC04_03830 [Verrucomicrobiota bacterium]
MITLLFIIGLVASGLAVLSALIARVPYGYENEAGFHYGQEHGVLAEETSWVMAEPKIA